MTTEIVPIEEERERKRNAALLRAIGLDKVPPEQREISLRIADKYGLDLLLRHLVLVDGKPYITRDGLLHVAHRSGVLDGIEVTDPALVKLEGQGDFWTARCSVWRKDMSRAFTYQGRYPAKGGNQRFAPEMATKVAEVMALRRAFDVSAPVMEERWDMEASEPPEPLATITDTIAAKRAAITSGPAPLVPREAGPAAVAPLGVASQGQEEVRDDAAFTVEEPPLPADHAGAQAANPVPKTGSADLGNPMPAPKCTAFSAEHGKCVREAHEGLHRNKAQETWA